MWSPSVWYATLTQTIKRLIKKDVVCLCLLAHRTFSSMLFFYTIKRKEFCLFLWTPLYATTIHTAQRFKEKKNHRYSQLRNNRKFFLIEILLMCAAQGNTHQQSLIFYRIYLSALQLCVRCYVCLRLYTLPPSVLEYVNCKIKESLPSATHPPTIFKPT